jgi:hypothetical protein
MQTEEGGAYHWTKKHVAYNAGIWQRRSYWQYERDGTVFTKFKMKFQIDTEVLGLVCFEVYFPPFFFQ